MNIFLVIKHTNGGENELFKRFVNIFYSDSVKQFYFNYVQ